jgi:hypothetical protein
MGMQWSTAVYRTAATAQDKVDKHTAEIHQVVRRRKQAIPHKQFDETIHGKLRHECIGIPAGKG